RADPDAARSDAANVPLTIPKFGFARPADLFGQAAILRGVSRAAQIFGGFHERPQRPVVQERHQGAFPAAQVEAIVPVRAKAFADARRTGLRGGKIEGPLEVLV